jgi:hypothetical protein
MTFPTTITPFDGDALNRHVFADNLSNLILRYDRGVIAVDGAWGSGKTWLGKNLSNSLEIKTEAKVKTVWIDTFEADWDDDPTLSLLGAFAEQLTDEKRAEFVSAVAPYAAKLLLSIGKVAIQAVGKKIGIDEDQVNEIADAIAGTGDEYIKKKINDLAERKQSLATLKTILQEYIKEKGIKLVIFVDELDRCSPVFAIRFLERIKHLFDLENVVFVLLWNRTQIQNAVRVFYGEDTDGLMYLDRFIDWSFHLPNHHDTNGEQAMFSLIDKFIEKTNKEQQGLLISPRSWVAATCHLLTMNAREVTNVCKAIVNIKTSHMGAITIWLICLKIKSPTIYSKLRNKNNEGHNLAAEFLNEINLSNSQIHNFFQFARQFHIKNYSGDTVAYEAFLAQAPQTRNAFNDRDFTMAIEQLELQWR